MEKIAKQQVASKAQGRDIILDAVKGFLILCIILEHNTLLTAEYDWIRPFADAFAAGCFLILTFIWPLKPLSSKTFFDKYFSYWIPFIAFTTITTIANAILFSSNDLSDLAIQYIKAILLASPFDLKQATGFMYLWFLPCLSILYLFRRFHQKLGISFLILPITSFFFLGVLDDTLLISLPFSLHVIGFIYILGVIYAKLHPYFMQLTSINKFTTASLFIILLISTPTVGWQLFLAGGIMPSWQQMPLLLYYGVIMLLAIPSLYFILSIMPKLIISFTALLGQESLKVYLLHPIIFILITRIFPITSHGIVSLIATVLISLAIALGITKIKQLNQLIFPHTVSDLLTAFRR